MMSVSTLWFLKMLQELSKSTKVGFFPFSRFTVEMKLRQNILPILYDDNIKSVSRGVPNEHRSVYPIVWDYLVDRMHHDVIATATDSLKEPDWEIMAVCDKDDDGSEDWYVEIRYLQDDTCMVVSNDEWYFV